MSLLGKENLQAFRLYHLDIPEYPYIIDVLLDQVVLWPKTNPKIDQNKGKHLDETIAALKQLLDVNEDKIHIKWRDRKKGLKQYQKMGHQKESIIVEENGIKFLINLTDYLDYGLFLDHRPFRNKLKKNTFQKSTLLNLFSYTCSISVAAAIGGMETTSVDISNTYLNWGKENFRLNEIDPQKHSFIKESSLSYLKKTALENNKFDLIFLDPPTFSNSKSMDKEFEVEKDQVFLVDHCMQLLSKDGILFFSNNKKRFKINPILNQKYQIKDVSLKSIPADFRDKHIHHLFEIKNG